MSNQKVTVDGVEYGVWFMHSKMESEIDRSVEDALELGQIGKHALDPHAPYVSRVTRCQLERLDRSIASVGYSFCSDIDNFNKKNGRARAMNRAIGWLKKELANV